MPNTVYAASPEPSAARLSHLLACAARLPSPPVIVTALLASLGDDRSSMAAIAENAERDQAMTARLLRVANSPYYGLSGHIATVRDAAMLLGTGMLRNMIIATEMLSRYSTQPGRNPATFWRHAILAAFCAETLARRAGADAGAAFSAGLLHDIGKLVLATAFPDDGYARAAACADPIEIERSQYGIDHASLGERIAARWRFPAAIRAALGTHHDPAPRDKFSRIVALADKLAHVLAAPCGRGDLLPLCTTALAALGSRDTAADVLAELECQAAAAAELAPDFE